MLEFPLDVLWAGGHEAEIGEVRDALQRIAGASRQVSTKAPNIGCREALAEWDAVAQVVQKLARIRAALIAKLP
jgi:hypothetical protein